MKKLLVVAAVALAAAVSQAAAVTWQITNIQSSPNVTAAAGWMIQLYSADTAFDYNAAKAGTIAALDSTTSYASGTILRSSSTFGDYAANSPVNTYAVIYDAATVADAKNYIVSDVAYKNINATGSPLSVAFGNMAGTTTTNLFRNSDWVAVPEPTSGLLMLLGMAGLALRRRRA
jgi:hypothetical protein